jgi:hypothetical protein
MRIWLQIWCLATILFWKTLGKNQELVGKLIHLVILIPIQDFLLKWDLMLCSLPDLITKIKIREWTTKNWSMYGDLHNLGMILTSSLTYYISIIVLHTVLILMKYQTMFHGSTMPNRKISMLSLKHKI